MKTRWQNSHRSIFTEPPGSYQKVLQMRNIFNLSVSLISITYRRWVCLRQDFSTKFSHFVSRMWFRNEHFLMDYEVCNHLSGVWGFWSLLESSPVARSSQRPSICKTTNRNDRNTTETDPNLTKSLQSVILRKWMFCNIIASAALSDGGVLSRKKQYGKWTHRGR